MGESLFRNKGANARQTKVLWKLSKEGEGPQGAPYREEL